MSKFRKVTRESSPLFHSSLLACLLAMGCNGSTSNSSPTNVGPVQLNPPGEMQVGVSFAGANYRFTNDNLLVEGGERAWQLGMNVLFIYLTPFQNGVSVDYPDGPAGSSTSKPTFGGAQFTSVADQVMSGPYRYVLGMPFKTIVMTTYTYSNPLAFNPGFDSGAEYAEMYALATNLLQTYQGTGRTFILKNWEGDWEYTNLGTITPTPAITQSFIDWFNIREKAVSDARAANPVTGVNVYLAAEINKVVDPTVPMKLIDLVIPQTNVDMVTYSSYDSTYSSNDPNSVNDPDTGLSVALDKINANAPDPLGLGPKRFFITEFGLKEDPSIQSQSQVLARLANVLNIAQAHDLPYAFFWTLYDNDCDTDIPAILITPSNPFPFFGTCTGYWAVKPRLDSSGNPEIGIASTQLQQSGYWTPRSPYVAPSSGTQ